MKKTVFLPFMIAVIALGSIGFIGFAYAQYMGNVGGAGETGVGTLEETLELAKRRIEAVEANPASGSGTPYLDADGVIGGIIIAGAVFGGMSAALAIKGRSGKYAAQGRG
jgi:hypothetical protein